MTEIGEEKLKKEIFETKRLVRKQLEYLNALRYYEENHNNPSRCLKYYDVIDWQGNKALCSWGLLPVFGVQYYDHEEKAIDAEYYPLEKSLYGLALKEKNSYI